MGFPVKNFRALVYVNDGRSTQVITVTVRAENIYAAKLMIERMYGAENMRSPVTPA